MREIQDQGVEQDHQRYMVIPVQDQGKRWQPLKQLLQDLNGWEEDRSHQVLEAEKEIQLDAVESELEEYTVDHHDTIRFQ